MKGDTEVILFIVFFFSGVFLGTVIADAPIDLYANTLMVALATLAAAFAGAKYAFCLQETKHLREIARSEVRAGNSLISSVGRVRNKFVAFRNQFIQPHRDNNIRHYLIQPATGLGGIKIDVDYNSLDFFFTSDDPDLTGRLSMLEQEVISTVELINQRSDLHYNRLQPAVEAIENGTGTTVKPGQIDKGLGARDAQVIRMLTDQMIESVDHVIDQSEQIASEVNNILKKLYPGHHIVKITYPNRGNEST